MWVILYICGGLLVKCASHYKNSFRNLDLCLRPCCVGSLIFKGTNPGRSLKSLDLTFNRVRGTQIIYLMVTHSWASERMFCTGSKFEHKNPNLVKVEEVCVELKQQQNFVSLFACQLVVWGEFVWSSCFVPFFLVVWHFLLFQGMFRRFT